MCVYVRTKFQISSVILTSFRRGIILPTPPHPYPPLKTPDQIKVNLKTITNKCSLSFKYNLFAHKSVNRWPTSRINILTIYYKLGQGFITNSGSFVLLQIGAAQLIQNGAAITNQGNRYYKLGQTLLQIRAAITNRGNYYKLGHNKQQCIKKNNVKTQKQSENWTCDMLSKTSVQTTFCVTKNIQ